MSDTSFMLYNFVTVTKPFMGMKKEEPNLVIINDMLLMENMKKETDEVKLYDPALHGSCDQECYCNEKDLPDQSEQDSMEEQKLCSGQEIKKQLEKDQKVLESHDHTDSKSYDQHEKKVLQSHDSSNEKQPSDAEASQTESSHKAESEREENKLSNQGSDGSDNGETEGNSLNTEGSTEKRGVDENGWTALHWAVWEQDEDLVSTLLEHDCILVNAQTTQNVKVSRRKRGERKSLSVVDSQQMKPHVEQATEKADDEFERSEEEKTTEWGKLEETGHKTQLAKVSGVQIHKGEEEKDKLKTLQRYVIADLVQVQPENITINSENKTQDMGIESIERTDADMTEVTIRAVLGEQQSQRRGSEEMPTTLVKEPVVSDTNGNVGVESKAVTQQMGSDELAIPKGSAPAHLAVMLDNCSIVKRLYNTACDWVLEDSNSHTPLHLAAKQDNVDLVRHFLSLGHSVNFVNSNGDTALHTAMMYRSEKVVRYLLEREDTDVTLANRYKKQPLHLAIQTHNTEFLTVIINLIKKKKQQSSNDDLVNQSNNSTTTSTSDDSTPELEASIMSNKGFIKRHNVNSINPARFAMMQNNVKCLRILLDEPSMFHYMSEEGPGDDPILHFAARLGMITPKMTWLLLHRGADVNALSQRIRSPHTQYNTRRRCSERTALDVAINMNNLDLAIMLMSAGAGVTPLAPSPQGTDGVTSGETRGVPGVRTEDMGLIFNNLDNPPQALSNMEKLLQLGYKFPVELYKSLPVSAGFVVPQICWERDRIVNHIREFYKQPLSLSRLTGNLIITSLRPNAWVGVQKLPLPPIMKSYITMDIPNTYQ